MGQRGCHLAQSCKTILEAGLFLHLFDSGEVFEVKGRTNDFFFPVLYQGY